MNKIFQLIGGRKFLLTVVSMGGAALIDLYTMKGLSMPLATFLGAALAAFCASNYAVSREFMRTEAEKKTAGVTGGVTNEEIKELLLDLQSGNGQDKVMLENINNVLVQIAEAAGNTLITAKATNNTLQAALNVARKT